MRITLVAVTAGAVLALAGCAGDTAPVPPDEPVPFGTHHVDPKDDMPAAQVLGTLMLADGCLMVAFEGIEYPLVLPDIARWNEPAQELTIEGRTYALGEEVSWGGGYWSGADMPAACPAGAEVAHVYQTS